MTKIHDEFTDEPFSRERKRQMRRVRDGFCSTPSCKAKLFIGEVCVSHYLGFRPGTKSVNTKAHRRAAELGLGEFYIDNQFNKQFRWTDKRILRLLKNGGK